MTKVPRVEWGPSAAPPHVRSFRGCQGREQPRGLGLGRSAPCRWWVESHLKTLGKQTLTLTPTALRKLGPLPGLRLGLQLNALYL